MARAKPAVDRGSLALIPIWEGSQMPGRSAHVCCSLSLSQPHLTIDETNDNGEVGVRGGSNDEGK